jgi:putative zinc finger protein
MTLLTCAAVRRRLQAFYDRELPVRELIDIEAHLSDCPPCDRDLKEMRLVGDVLRLAAAPGPADDWTGLQPGVISRMRAEAHESWTARATRAFDDMHLLWIGLAATAATCLCAAAVLSMVRFASPERNDSLADVFAVMAAPLGSDENPARLERYIQVPSVPEDGIVSAALESGLVEPDRVLALSAVVTRAGRVSNLALLTKEYDVQSVADLVDALSRGRLEPARFGGSPVAVNLVWLVAHTTVKGKSSS